jgi:hypothetical protein
VINIRDEETYQTIKAMAQEKKKIEEETGEILSL